VHKINIERKEFSLQNREFNQVLTQSDLLQELEKLHAGGTTYLSQHI